MAGGEPAGLPTETDMHMAGMKQVSEPLPSQLRAAFAAESDWVAALRAYLLVIAAGNLVWEAAQLPLYTIWTEATRGEKLFAVVHCTGGDLLIALTSLSLALVVVGNRRWPGDKFAAVAVLMIVFGVIYTIFSEWLNIVMRESWKYSDLMPVVPIIDTGLSPLLQWIIVPSAALFAARRAAYAISAAAPTFVSRR